MRQYGNWESTKKCLFNISILQCLYFYWCILSKNSGNSKRIWRSKQSDLHSDHSNVILIVSHGFSESSIWYAMGNEYKKIETFGIIVWIITRMSQSFDDFKIRFWSCADRKYPWKISPSWSSFMRRLITVKGNIAGKSVLFHFACWNMLAVTKFHFHQVW